MRTVLTLVTGITLGYILSGRKEETINSLANTISDGTVKIGVKIQDFFSTSAKTY